ncbi:tRNA-methyltransferase [Pseudozyma hubeiensis]|nr:tRNA-methyltransferase [Pseudozyma hubeiensis]
MKTITFSLAALAIVAAASITSATPTHPKETKPVPWAQEVNQDATKWALYSARKGTDLNTVKPKYSECTVTNPSQKEYVISHTFVNNSEFEFQNLEDDVLGANCIDCSPQMLGNYYLTKISGYLTCKMYEDKPVN